MNETPQLASAMLTVLFAAVMLVAGHFYLESRSTTPLSPSPTTLKVSLRWDVGERLYLPRNGRGRTRRAISI